MKKLTKRLLVLVCILCSITACASNKPNTQEEPNPQKQAEETLKNEYELVEVYQYKEHDQDINKVLLYIDHNEVYLVYYEDINTYKALKIVKENIQTKEETVICDLTNQNYVVDWLTVEDQHTYIIYHDSSLSYYVGDISTDFTIIDQNMNEISKFYQTSTCIYYATREDEDINIKSIKNGQVSTTKTINSKDSVLPINESGKVSNDQFIFSNNHEIYLFDQEQTTAYTFDYTVLNAIQLNDVLVINEYYLQQDQAKYRVHFYDLNTKKEINVADTKLSELYTNNDHLIYSNSKLLKVLTIDENDQIISVELNNIESKTIWTHLNNNYYKKCYDYNTYTIYAIQYIS